MNAQRHRFRTLIAATVLATGIIASTAAPAWAGDDTRSSRTGDACWLNADTGTTLCFADEAALDAAVLKLTGGVLVEEGQSQARTSSGAVVAASGFVLARLYENTGYGGAFITVSASTSTLCTTGSYVSPSMPLGWNNRVSSFQSYYNCSTRIYEDPSYGGASLINTDLTSLGAMNDDTESFRVS